MDIAATGLAVLAFVILLLHVLTHFPFFDEILHAHYLWLFSSGLKADVDFLCTYPALGYFLTLPFMRLFPDSAFLFLALRCLSVVIAVLIGIIFYLHGRRSSQYRMSALLPYLLVGTAPAIGAFFAEYSTDHMAALAAFGAMFLFFRPPRLWSVAVASALSIISIAIMPKYPVTLFFGMLGYLAAHYLKYRRASSLLLASTAGACAALLGIWLLFTLNNTSLVDNFRYSDLLQMRRVFTNRYFRNLPLLQPLIVSVMEFLIYNPVIGLSVALGVSGWARRSWRNADSTALGGGGILIGVLITSLMTKNNLSQYIAPQVLCLSLFAPFAFSLFKSDAAAKALSLTLVAAALVTLSPRLGSVAAEFRETPLNARGVTPTLQRVLGRIVMGPIGIVALNDYDKLLKIIPKNERVVAVWPVHPIFRRDVTPIAFDEYPSYSVSLPADDRLKGFFDPEYFLQTLEKNPPAMISLERLEMNYPPGWKEVAGDFLDRHGDLYVTCETELFSFSIRKDLAGKCNATDNH